MEKRSIPKHTIQSLVITIVAVAIIVAGVFAVFRSQESPRDAGPRVEIERGTYPEGWLTYQHPSYAVAYPNDMHVLYDETFDVLSFFTSLHATEPVARIFPSRSVELELEQLRLIRGSRVSTAEVYGEVMQITRVQLDVPNDAGGEDRITYYMFTDKLNKKTYTFKVDGGASWDMFGDVAETIRTP